MAEGRPRLVAVGDPPRPEGVRRAGVPPSRGWLPLALLGAVLLVCALGWGLTRREANRLAAELAASQQALAAATARLEAAEARRAEVQDRVQGLQADASALAGRLADLEPLVAADLEPAADAQPSGNEAPEGD